MMQCHVDEVSEQALEYIRRFYSVPANAGTRIEYAGGETKREGEIVGGEGAYLKVRLDGDTYDVLLHPTWKVTYLPESGTDGS